MERTVLKSFPVGYIHVKVKVCFRCIKFKTKLQWFWLPIFCTKINISSQNEPRGKFVKRIKNILETLLISINSKYKVS
jgi:hypothetical protein